MLDLVAVMERLARKRPVFHSEADFQHALAWELHEVVPDAQVRLEYRVPGLERTYLDIWLTTADGLTAIELKYVTRRLTVTVANEPFELNQHAAQPLRRYDFIKDIARLERVVAAVPAASAVAIFLTNEDAYWKEARVGEQIDLPFRIHEGRTLSGPMLWSDSAGGGTIDGRQSPLMLHGSYPLRWRDYTMVAERAGRFRYLLVGIGQVN